MNLELGRLGRIRFGWQLVQDREFLKLNEIDISALHGHILGQAVFSRLDEKTPHHVLLNWKGLDLSLLEGVLPAEIYSHASGSMDLSFAAFKRSALQGSLSAQFEPKTVRPQDRDKVALAGDLLLTFLRGTISIQSAHLLSQGNSIKGEFTIDQDRLSGFINGRINHLRGILLAVSPFNDTLHSLAETKIDGEMRIAVQLSGTTAKPVLQARFTQGRIKNLTRSPLEFAGSIFLKDQVLRIDDMRISQSGAMVVVHGTLPVGSAGQGMDVRVQSPGLDLARLGGEFPLALPRMRGILDFDVRLSKKPDVPFLFQTAVDGDFSLADFHFEQMQFGNVRGKINSTEEKLNLWLHLPSGNSEISGVMDLRRPFAAKIEVSTRDGSIKEFLKLLPVPVRDRFTGEISGKVQVAFLPLRFKESLSISFELSDFLVASGNRKLRNLHPLRLAYRSGALVMEDVQFMLDRVEVRATGELASAPGGGKEITISARGAGDFLSMFLPDLLFEGNLDARIVIKGSVAAPVFSGSIRVDQGRLLVYSHAMPLTNVHAQLEMKEHAWVLPAFHFTVGRGEVTGKGSMPLSFLKLPINGPPGPSSERAFQLELDISRCPLASLGTVLAGSFPENTSGDASGSIRLHGENPDLSDLAGAATISLADLSLSGMSFSLEEPMRIIGGDGRVVLQRVVLTGPEDLQLVANGFVGLQKEKPLGLFLKGKLDSQIMNGFFPELTGSGRFAFELQVGGTLNEPEWNGRIEVVDNHLQFAPMNLFANQLHGAVSFHDGRFAVERMTGNLNGGAIGLTGSLTLAGRKPPVVDLQLQMADVKFNYPKGLFTDLSGRLHWRTSPPGYVLEGNIDLNGGNYNESFSVGSYLYEFLFNRKEIDFAPGDAGFTKRVRLAINLKTPRAVAVENNVSRSEINAEVSVGGTIFQPQLSGRIYVKEGGSIFFGNRIFTIEKGQISFVNPNMIEPDFNIVSRTQVGVHDIQLTLSGTPRDFIASFSSIPALSEPAIVSLLTIGKTTEDLSGSIFYETGNVALNYLSYAVTGKLEGLIKKNLGLQSFRIDGSLLSSKEDPGAKITIGKNITPNLELAYSQGLRQTQDQTWVLNYKPFPSLNFQGIKSSTDLYTLGVQYQLRFHSARGAVPRADARVKKPAPLLVEKIRIEGDPVLALPVIMKQIKQKAGRVFSFAKFQEDSERIRRLFQRQDYLSADIAGNYFPGERGVTLIYRIRAGSKVFLGFSGEGLTRSLRKKCIRQWLEGRFDAQRASNVIRELTRFFSQKKYYQVSVSSQRVEKDTGSFVHFSVARGRKTGRVEYDLAGNRQVADREIIRELKARRLEARLFSQPGEVGKKLEEFYKNKGFLKAKVLRPQISFSGPAGTAVIRIQIEENVLFRINTISFSGSAIVPEKKLLELTGLKTNMPLPELQVMEPGARIERYYRKMGFNQVQATLKTVLAEAEGRADIEIVISAGVQGVVGAIEILGNRQTRESVIIRELTFKAGDSVDFYEINRSRKKLYDLGIFDLVDLELTAMDAAPPQSAAPETEVDGAPRTYFQVRIKVRESPVYRLKLGGQYDTDSQLGVRFEGENSNLFGSAHSIGAGFQWSGKEIDTRGYYRLPNLLFNKANTIVTVFFNKKEEPSFRDERQGLTIQQQVLLGKTQIVSLNYTRERSEITNGPDPGTRSERSDVAHVTLGYYHDKRDNIFNPGRGFSVSGSIQHAAKFMGSDYPFIRYSGQFDFFLPAAPRLTWGSSLAVGLVDELGQKLSLAEKFFASGRGTIRGFDANEVGPVDAATGQAIGGDAILIFRQELRWQLLPLISMVGFTDWGNLFVRGVDHAIFKLRKSAGIGVRFHLQPLLIRLDWGMKLDRRPGEKHSTLYFGIGHIF